MTTPATVWRVQVGGRSVGSAAAKLDFSGKLRQLMHCTDKAGRAPLPLTGKKVMFDVHACTSVACLGRQAGCSQAC